MYINSNTHTHIHTQKQTYRCMYVYRLNVPNLKIQDLKTFECRSDVKSEKFHIQPCVMIHS